MTDVVTDQIGKKGKNYVCLVCDGYKHKQLWLAKRHFRQKHVDLPVTCYICQEVFKNPESLKNHLYRRHGIAASVQKEHRGSADSALGKIKSED